MRLFIDKANVDRATVLALVVLLTSVHFAMGAKLDSPQGESVRLPLPVGVDQGRQPQVAVSKNNIYIAFGDKDSVYCTTSVDGGKSFSTPVLVAKLKALSLGLRRGPRIVASERFVTITAVGGELGEGRGGDLLAWRSSDQGKTWSGPSRVNHEATSAREGLHDTAIAIDGTMFAVWLDDRNGYKQLFGASSHDGGATWSEDRLIYKSPTGAICPCCHPTVAYDAEGKLFVMWRNQIDEERDLYLASSTDHGQTFSEAIKLGSGTWEIDFCPMDGGSIAPFGDGELATVWRREKQIFRVNLANPQEEEQLGVGEQAWTTGTPQGAFFVWLTKRGGPLWLLSPNEKSPRMLAEHAADPVVASDNSGTGPVVIAWEEKGKDRTVMRVSVLSK